MSDLVCRQGSGIAGVNIKRLFQNFKFINERSEYSRAEDEDESEEVWWWGSG